MESGIVNLISFQSCFGLSRNYLSILTLGCQFSHIQKQRSKTSSQKQTCGDLIESALNLARQFGRIGILKNRILSRNIVHLCTFKSSLISLSDCYWWILFHHKIPWCVYLLMFWFSVYRFLCTYFVTHIKCIIFCGWHWKNIFKNQFA